MVSTKRMRTSLIASMVIVLGLLACVWATTEISIQIQVSPNVLNLLNKGEVVTVHTDIAYSSVAGLTVSLNDVEINYWKADNRGNFVAKFVMEEIKGLSLNIGKPNTLTLKGETDDGEEFVGSTEILVVNNVPNKK